MELTREEAIRLHRELWGWLTENPMKGKTDWPGWSKLEAIRFWCPCCEYTKYDWNIQTCKENCPLEWKRLRNLSDPPCLCSYYKDWERATAPEERSRLAAIIRDLPEKPEKKEPLKPQYNLKKGDKVKVKADLSLGSFYDNGCYFVQEMQNYRGKTGIIVDISFYGDEPRYRLNIASRWAFSPSMLEPAESPKPEPEKQAEAVFQVGDRVRVKGYWNYDGYKPNLPIEGKHGIIICGNNVRFEESIGGHGEGCRNWCVDGKYLEPLPSNRCPEPKTITETITFKLKGAKTTCIIENEQGRFKGVAKCSPQDEWKESRGMALAKIRAQEAMIRAE